ncbi:MULTISPECIES: FtsX-like permease family protein [unclassified Rathayibacter]|uniref:FtsX-like permease family protein n=1 Tax=unclassified Rathayibacter TaxID=2609250 RepID=UPI0006FD84D0|nr:MULTISPECIES: FtsX-like permease family protein [unclassified Rathayibacter]KQQ05886.1 hypothetical protein ASF42_04915 [Rathayibacter sp. Leaf294]KQS13743.1 hypothetical protein ASG06_04925 [Rathayibacter sp. Leaf185]
MRHTLRAAVAAPAMTIALAVLSLLVAGLLVLVPAMSAASATAALREDLGRESRVDLTTQGLEGLSTGGDDPWARIDSSLRALRDEQPEPLASALGEPGEAMLLEAVPVAALVPGDPVRASQLALAFEPELADDVELTAGALPGAPTLGDEPSVPIVLSDAVAAEMVWPVGERRRIELPEGGFAQVELTGTFAPRDADASVWTHVPEVLRPAILLAGSGGTLARATALVDPTSWPRLATLPITSRLLAWYPVEVDRVEGSEAPLLAQQLRTFAGRQQEVDGGLDPGYTFATTLPVLLDRSLAEQRASDAFVGTAVSGPALGGAVVLALILLLLGRARGPALALLEARGASAARRRRAPATEAGVASLAGTVLGAGAGVLLSQQLTGGVVIEGWAVATAAGLVLVVAGAAALGQSRARPVLRLAAEALLVLATLAVVLALVQGAPLPFATVLAPLLGALTIAAGAARLLPLALGAQRRRARRGPGAVGLLASARVDGALVVVGIAGALAVALFSGALLTTVRAAVVDDSVAEVGADLAVRGGSTSADVDALRALPGVGEVAAVVADDPATVSIGAARAPMRIVVVDSAALARVQAGLVGRLPIPEGFAETEADGTVPVIASRAAAAEIGDATVSLRGHDLAVVGTADDASPLTSAAQWLLVDVATALELRVQPGVADVVLVRLDDTAGEAAVRASVSGEVVTASGVAAERLGSPRLAAEQVALIGGVAGGVLAAAAALLLAGIASAGARRRRASVLAALGMPRSQISLLDLAGAAVPAVIGAVAGVVAGLVLPFALIPLLDLPAVRLDPVTMLVTLGAFLLAAAVTVLRPSRGSLR